MSGRCLAGGAWLLVLTAVLGFAQPSPAFEAASIKKNTSGNWQASFGPRPGGRLHVENYSLRNIIQSAYDIASFQLHGGPDWIDSERYDLEAKAEGDPNWPQMRPMLQALLEDRCHLRVHRETRELPVYVLSVAKNGLKLQPSKDGSCVVIDPKNPPPRPAPGTPPPTVCGSVRASGNGVGATLTGARIDMARLTTNLTGNLGRPVIDKTGVTGTFDVHLEWSQDNAADASVPSIFTALQEQLGLKLETSKGPVEVVVIDRVERPTEN